MPAPNAARGRQMPDSRHLLDGVEPTTDQMLANAERLFDQLIPPGMPLTREVAIHLMNIFAGMQVVEVLGPMNAEIRRIVALAAL